MQERSNSNVLTVELHLFLWAIDIYLDLQMKSN